MAKLEMAKKNPLVKSENNLLCFITLAFCQNQRTEHVKILKRHSHIAGLVYFFITLPYN